MSTHKIVPGSVIPFPCWLWGYRPSSMHDNSKDMRWSYALLADGFNAIHYSTNPPDQPPLGEPAPEGSHDGPKCVRCGAALNDSEAKVFTVCDACWDATKSNDPTPSAPSLQSVAGGAARELEKLADAWDNHAIPYSQSDVQAILTRHFAPVYAALTERDARIKQLETDNNTLRAAQKACEDCMTPTYAALRTRCEELENYVIALEDCCGSATLKEAQQLADQRAARKEGQQAHQKGEGA